MSVAQNWTMRPKCNCERRITMQNLDAASVVRLFDAVQHGRMWCRFCHSMCMEAEAFCLRPEIPTMRYVRGWMGDDSAGTWCESGDFSLLRAVARVEEVAL